jgi:hypothetical protein
MFSGDGSRSGTLIKMLEQVYTGMEIIDEFDAT